MKTTSRSNIQTLQRQGKLPMECIDGPYKGHTLWVNGHSTAYITVNGKNGRYFHGRWYELSKHQDLRN